MGNLLKNQKKDENNEQLHENREKILEFEKARQIIREYRECKVVRKIQKLDQGVVQGFADQFKKEIK